MSLEQLQVNDLVMKIGDNQEHVVKAGSIGTVISLVCFSCFNCGRIGVSWPSYGDWNSSRELLKRIPPLDELERTQIVNEVTA